MTLKWNVNGYWMRTESKACSRESLLPSSKGKGQVESLGGIKSII